MSQMAVRERAGVQRVTARATDQPRPAIPPPAAPMSHPPIPQPQPSHTPCPEFWSLLKLTSPAPVTVFQLCDFVLFPLLFLRPTINNCAHLVVQSFYRVNHRHSTSNFHHLNSRHPSIPPRCPEFVSCLIADPESEFIHITDSSFSIDARVAKQAHSN